MREATSRFSVLLVLLGGSLVAARPLEGTTIYALNAAGQLLSFDSATPGTTTTPVTITGLQAFEGLLAIDFRPANGQLYGLGSSSRLYTINRTTGVATQVGTGQFATLLNGTSFGFDFNPTVDRIRVVSDLGQNLRLNPDTGAVAAVDTSINPAGFSVDAAAYTNNFAGATTTTLYTLDLLGNRLAIQDPPNAGTETAVGPLGLDPIITSSFDILTTASGDTAFAAMTTNGVSSALFSINLATGAATLIGTIGSSRVSGLAVLQGPSMVFSAPTYSVSETAGTATITVNRVGSSTGTVTVAYATSNGSATAGSDYTAASGILTFGDGVVTQTFTVPITDDTVFEGNETVNLTLSNPTGGAVLGPQGTAVLTIVDNETQPTISIDDVTVSEGAGTATFTVTLSGPSASTVAVVAQTANGTATAPEDFAATGPTTLTFVPLDTSETFTVSINNDTTFEGSEFFVVNLSDARNATIADGQGVGTIQDNDVPPQVPTLSFSMLALLAGLLATAGAFLIGRRTG